MSLSNYAEQATLDALFNNVSLSVANTYIKLHIGDPGEAGTANPAVHTTRVAASWANASGGSIATDAAVTFAGMTAAETISYVSVWDALANGTGNCIGSGPLSPSRTVAIGDTLNFPSGSITVTLD